MPANGAYVPPSEPTMAHEQNTDESLRLLVAQRAIYGKAKRYLSGRLVGMFVIATIAPIVGSIWPWLAATCGAVAGAWLFVGRTLLTSQQLKQVDRAAAVQEKFDTRVFGMPIAKDRENMPSLEDIVRVTGGKSQVKSQAGLEKLRDWYPFDAPAAVPAISVAICQRANVSYSDSLLRKTATIWRACICIWAFVAIILGIFLHASFEVILLIVVLPLLPAFLDSVEFSRAYDSAAHIRRTTANEIEKMITSKVAIEPSQLLVWQERIYELRRTTPLVPDMIYWAQRKANERAMTGTAKALADESQKP